MKKLMMLASALMLTGLLVVPAMAGGQGSKAPQPPAQARQEQVGKGQPESQGRALHRAYFQKRQEMRKYRDEMLKVRAKNVQSGE
ncbi:MAG: hypothetical protein FIB02_12170 [Desulfuromonas sp.]|nr:hypothetical protein [Desulfuromonas sp.]